jgi:hypothetical protein
MIESSLPYVLCRIEDDSSLTSISEYPSIGVGIVAGNHVVTVEDHEYPYCLNTDDGVRVSTFGKGRIGYREWAYRTGRLEFISSEDDKYLRDEDEWVS